MCSVGRYSNQHIIEFYKQKLKSMPCQNQGFILDGFPKTEDDAKELFAGEYKASIVLSIIFVVNCTIFFIS